MRKRRLRQKCRILFLAAVAAVLGYLLVAFLANRFRTPAAEEVVPVIAARSSTREAINPGETLRVMTWNIGYAGMGAESDFVADGGQQSRPLSLRLVEQNLAAITATLRDQHADVYMIEEAARPSWFTYQVDVLDGLVKALPEHDWFFGGDFSTRLVPPPWRTSIGNAIFSRYRIEHACRLALPLEPTFVAGTFRKMYRMHVARLGINGSHRSFVFVCIHVAAFDKNAEIRLEQIRRTIEFAQAEHARGNAVVIGGDFNLRLSPIEFPHQTDKRHLFWVHDWPDDLTPPGWTLAMDPEHPTNRTDHKPYVAGDNYACIIDGFLCSPDIVVERVRTLDLGFRHSDHQPVILDIRLRDVQSSETPTSK